MTTHIALKLKDFFPNNDFLSSREKGLVLRNEMLSKLDNAEKINLDFSGFDVITQSFTDELIGVLVREHGADFIRNHFEVSNAGSEIRAMLNLVVSYSAKQHKTLVSA